MAEEKKEKKIGIDIKGLNKGLYASLAAEYSGQKGGQTYAQIALEKFRKEDLDLDIKGFVGGELKDYLASEEATQKLVELYADAYSRELSKATISDLAEFYKPAFGKVSDSQKKVFGAEISKYGSKKMSDIEDEITDANYTLSRSSDEKKKEEAQKTLQKYNRLQVLMSMLEKNTISPIKQKIEYEGLEKILAASQKEEKKE